jgi:tungstate transport system permease protein
MAHEIVPILWMSLLVSAASVTASALVGLPTGVWLGMAEFRGRRFVATVVLTGMALPPVVVGLVVYLLLSRSGPLGGLGWLFTPQAMILAQFLLTLPFVVGVTMTAVASVPRELAVQLRAIGASDGQVRRTILREARPGIVLAVAAALGRSVSEVGAVLIVGGNIAGHTRVLTTAIVLETGKGQFALALLLGGVLLMTALAINLVVVRIGGRAPV